MKDSLPKRKTTHLKGFNYSSVGLYFITICTRDRKNLLSEITKTDLSLFDASTTFSVGEGLAPPAYQIRLKPCGKIAKEQLLLLENRFPSISIEDFIIMPDHIHAIVFLHEQAGGASPSPTLNEVVCSFKSLTSRTCKQRLGIEKMFQRSFSEHIVRDKADYETRRNYIHENPMRWYYKHLDIDEQGEI